MCDSLKINIFNLVDWTIWLFWNLANVLQYKPGTKWSPLGHKQLFLHLKTKRMCLPYKTRWTSSQNNIDQIKNSHK